MAAGREEDVEGLAGDVPARWCAGACRAGAKASDASAMRGARSAVFASRDKIFTRMRKKLTRQSSDSCSEILVHSALAPKG